VKTELTEANDRVFAFEFSGPPAGPVVALVAGMGDQLVDWPDEFCALLAGHGLRVLRFDNRDCGLSSLEGPAGASTFPELLALMPEVPAYLLTDLADDTAALLKALGVAPAHLVGRSMGGMVVQEMMLRHPDCVRSATLISTETGAPAGAEAEAVATPRDLDREGYLAYALESERWMAGTGQPFDEATTRARLERAFDRSFTPAGHLRQYTAYLATPDRTEALTDVDFPTLVLHGSDDPLIPVERGRALAATIPGARFNVLEGVGHDLPAARLTGIAQSIADVVAARPA
jgi:pimeloyl-ACP methyl ester carboxylesterase